MGHVQVEVGGIAVSPSLRAELRAHCYRMLGALGDAEERATEALSKVTSGEPPADRPRRALPSTLAPPSDAGDPLGAPLDDSLWLEPFPDALLDDDGASAE